MIGLLSVEASRIYHYTTSAEICQAKSCTNSAVFFSHNLCNITTCNLPLDVIEYYCQEGRADRRVAVLVEVDENLLATANSGRCVVEYALKIFRRNFKFPLDKPHTMWYNKGVNEGRLSPAG